MPRIDINKTQLRRISAIVKVLNTGVTIKQEQLRTDVVELIDRDFVNQRLKRTCNI